jgi:hypothetical protein
MHCIPLYIYYSITINLANPYIYIIILQSTLQTFIYMHIIVLQSTLQAVEKKVLGKWCELNTLGG